MRYKKQTIVIASLTVIVAFIQCSKTFEKADINPVTAEEHAISRKKANLWLPRERKYFALMILVIRIFGVDYYILTRL